MKAVAVRLAPRIGRGSTKKIRRLRNSTKIATQFLGLEQCSPKSPDFFVEPKHGLNDSGSQPHRDLPSSIYRFSYFFFHDGCGRLSCSGGPDNQAALWPAIVRRGFLRALSESRFLRSKNCRVAQQPPDDGRPAAVCPPRTRQVPIGKSQIQIQKKHVLTFTLT